MKITKEITAFKQLETFAQDNWDKVGNVVKTILINRSEKKFEDHMMSVYPLGCSEIDFKDYCLTHQSEILKEV